MLHMFLEKIFTDNNFLFAIFNFAMNIVNVRKQINILYNILYLITHCHQYTARPACPSVQSDQALSILLARQLQRNSAGLGFRPT